MFGANGETMSTSTSGALRLAEDYAGRGKYQEAIGIYQRVLETEPSNLAARARLGGLLMLAGQNPAAAEVFSELAKVYAAMGQPHEAIANLKQMLRLEPKNADALVRLGNLCAETDLTAEAELRYLQAAEIYSHNQDVAKLQLVYERAVSVAPDNPELQLKFGALCHRTGRLDSGYLAFMKAADEFSRQGDQQAALDAYGKALKIAPSASEAERAAREVMRNLNKGGGDDTPVPNGSHGGLQIPANGQPAVTRRMERSDVPGPAPATAFIGPDSIGKRDAAAAPSQMQFAGPVSVEPGPGSTARAKTSGPHSGDIASRTNGTSARQIEGSEEEETLIGKISKAEILFGFGSFDEAIAILDNLVHSYPDELRVYAKLKDIYLRSEMPEKAAEACLQMARIYEARGENEMAAHSMASARRLANVAPEYSGSKGTGNLGLRPAGVTRTSSQPKAPSIPDGPRPVPPTRPVAVPANQTTPSARQTKEGQQPASPSTRPQPSQSNAPHQSSAPPVVETPQAPPPLNIPAPAARVQKQSGQTPRELNASARVEVPKAPTVPPPQTTALPLEVAASKANGNSGPARYEADKHQIPADTAASIDSLPRVDPRLATPVPAPKDIGLDYPPAALPLAEADTEARPAIVLSEAASIVNSGESTALAVVAPAAVKKVSKGTLLGVSMDTGALDAVPEKSSSKRSLVAAAVVLIALAGGAGGYFAMHSHHSKVAAATEPAPQPTEAPSALVADAQAAPDVVESSTNEAEPKTIDHPADTGLTPQQKEQQLQQQKREEEQARQAQLEQIRQAQAQAQAEREAQAQNRPAPSPSASQTQQPTVAAPPSMNNIRALPAGNSAGPSLMPGGIARDTQTPPPPVANTPPRARSTGVIYGEIIRRVQPSYPQSARATHTSGSVSVQVNIDEGGNVVSAHIVSGQAIFAGAAESAARGFKFKPTMLDGKAIKTSRTIVFNFKE